jgi:hypothetical protein
MISRSLTRCNTTPPQHFSHHSCSCVKAPFPLLQVFFIAGAIIPSRDIPWPFVSRIFHGWGTRRRFRQPFLAGVMILITLFLTAGFSGQATKPLLDGTGLTLRGYVHTGTLAQALSGSKLTLDFCDDGRITGPAGGNRYFGPVYDDGNIAFDRFGRVNEDALRYTGCDAAGEHLPCTY